MSGRLAHSVSRRRSSGGIRSRSMVQSCHACTIGGQQHTSPAPRMRAARHAIAVGMSAFLLALPSPWCAAPRANTARQSSPPCCADHGAADKHREAGGCSHGRSRLGLHCGASSACGASDEARGGRTHGGGIFPRWPADTGVDTIAAATRWHGQVRGQHAMVDHGIRACSAEQGGRLHSACTVDGRSGYVARRPPGRGRPLPRVRRQRVPVVPPRLDRARAAPALGRCHLEHAP